MQRGTPRRDWGAWLGYTAGTLISLALIAGSLMRRLEFDITEVLGFVTGGWGVWLTVRENIWNWPIGIANSVFFLALFVQARLFADSALQVVYIVLGALGWYWWLRGGTARTALPIARTTPRAAVALAAQGLAATAALTLGLARVGDAAPFWDALTTTLSLVAQYMLTRKLIENWLVWMTADAVYVALYWSRALHLTAGLYALFFALCVAGLVQWRAASRARDAIAPGTEILSPILGQPGAPDPVEADAGLEAAHG